MPRLALATSTLALALLLSVFSSPPAVAAGCEPSVQWSWDGETRSPDRPLPTSNPVVVQLTDDDGDGEITLDDIPDVVFIHCSVSRIDRCSLQAVDGATGADILSVDGIDILPMALAAGDLDGDGLVELIVVESDRQTVTALSHRGDVKWRSLLPRMQEISAMVGIADLDGDGFAEVILGATVLRSDGSPAWDGSAGRGLPLVNVGPLPSAADLLPSSPGLELLAGNTLYRADGSIAWTRADLADGYTAVGDLDGDGVPEILLSTRDDATEERLLHVLDPDGNSLAAPWTVDPGPIAAPAAVADLDGDGVPEFLLPASPRLIALKWDGSSLSEWWSAPIDDSGCCVGTTAFDVDGDGLAEVLYRDESGWTVLEGMTGVELESVASPSDTYSEMPLVVELDHDGFAEILIAGGGDEGDVTAYECATPVPARCIWNELAYHVTNVADDGGLPRAERPPWSAGAGWRVQSARPCGACTSCEDLLALVEQADIAVEGLRRSLAAKVEAACRADERGAAGTAGNVLCAFLHEVDAQDGKQITTASAEELRRCAWGLAHARDWPMDPCVE